jgi:hypothetical protein
VERMLPVLPKLNASGFGVRIGASKSSGLDADRSNTGACDGGVLGLVNVAASYESLDVLGGTGKSRAGID